MLICVPHVVRWRRCVIYLWNIYRVFVDMCDVWLGGGAGVEPGEQRHRGATHGHGQDAGSLSLPSPHGTPQPGTNGSHDCRPHTPRATAGRRAFVHAWE
jgi:hypothetical protein